MDSHLVWVPDTIEGYIKGYISEIVRAKFEVAPLDNKYYYWFFCRSLQANFCI